jgi:hypothetical protein
MLIMDLQMKKRQILKDILLCREELVQCDRNEITELTRSSTEMQGSKTFVAGDEEDEEAGDHVSVRSAQAQKHLCAQPGRVAGPPAMHP